MKKVIAVLIALMMFFVSGCGQNTRSSVSEEKPDEWGITLSAENVTATGMMLVCTQSGGKAKGELQTGSPFLLERFIEGEWLPVGVKPGLEVAWTMEGWMIPHNATTKWRVDWEWMYGYLEPGIYRMSKVVMDFRGPGKYTEKTYYAEFSIEI